MESTDTVFDLISGAKEALLGYLEAKGEPSTLQEEKITYRLFNTEINYLVKLIKNDLKVTE